MNTHLKNRILWYNGMSEVAASDVPLVCVKNNVLPSSLIVSECDDVTKFNELYPLNKIQTKCPRVEFKTEYPSFGDYCIIDRVFDLFFDNFVTGLSKAEINERYDRLEKESDLINRYNIEQYIKTVYEVTVKLRSMNTVWSGRGSSCACYTLYILGIHNIDSVKYNIPFTEFFR